MVHEKCIEKHVLKGNPMVEGTMASRFRRRALEELRLRVLSDKDYAKRGSESPWTQKHSWKKKIQTDEREETLQICQTFIKRRKIWENFWKNKNLSRKSENVFLMIIADRLVPPFPFQLKMCHHHHHLTTHRITTQAILLIFLRPNPSPQANLDQTPRIKCCFFCCSRANSLLATPAKDRKVVKVHSLIADNYNQGGNYGSYDGYRQGGRSGRGIWPFASFS